MADSPSLLPPPPPLLAFCSSLSISLSPSLACLPGSSPLPSSHPLWPYCFTSLHSGFYGYFVLVWTHLTAGWWVPPPVIAAIYYQRRSTSHFSDFGKMVFTLDRFSDLPYNISTVALTQAHEHAHTPFRLCMCHTQKGNLTSLYYTADLLGAKMLHRLLMPHGGIHWQIFQIILCIKKASISFWGLGFVIWVTFTAWSALGYDHIKSPIVQFWCNSNMVKMGLDWSHS